MSTQPKQPKWDDLDWEILSKVDGIIRAMYMSDVVVDDPANLADERFRLTLAGKLGKTTLLKDIKAAMEKLRAKANG